MLRATQKGIVDAFERIALRSKREGAQMQKIQRKLTAEVSDLFSRPGSIVRMVRPIKKIGVKLKEIPRPNLMQPGKRHPTSAIIDESVVIGRETDREKVVGSSTSDGDSSAGNSGIQVVPNMGGLGKPTLPQPACEEVAKESADVIILDDNFSTIVAEAKWGRSVYINIQKFVQFQLTLMVVALIVNFSSACLTGHVLLTAVQLLWVNMLKVTLGALALATEPPLDDLMKREPVRRSGGFISNVMWRNILGQSLYQIVVIWYLQTRGKRSFQLAGPDADLILNTLIFNIFFFCQVFNEISSREMEKINVFKGMLKNYVFVGALTCAVAFQVIIIEFLGDFANTTPLTSAQWFLSIFIGFLGIPIAAIIKLIALVSERYCMQAWKALKHYLPLYLTLYLPLLISSSLSLSFPFSLPLPFTPSLKLDLSHSPSLSLSLGSPPLSLSFSTEQQATSSSSSASPSSSSPASLQCCPSSSQEPFVPLQHPHHLCNCKTESHAALPDDCANSSRGMCIKPT